MPQRGTWLHRLNSTMRRIAISKDAIEHTLVFNTRNASQIF
jgi:hypothetical protein